MEITIKGNDTGNLSVKIPFRNDLLTAIREVPGRVWNRQQKVWEIPDTPDSGSVLLARLYRTGLFTLPEPLQKEALHTLLTDYVKALEARHYSPWTRKTYRIWAERFVSVQAGTEPRDWTESDINRFLTRLAVNEKVSASTRNQALAAVLFLFRSVLNRPVGELGNVIRARKPERLPVVMTRAEMRAVLD